MSRLMLLVAALSICALSFAGPGKIVEPKCCKGKTCKHVVGESKKHHKCNKKCHDKHQKKGTCCRGHKH